MFERFTDRARRVVVLAQVEARLLNHNYIGTEHILLGLVHEGQGVACEALESLGVSLEAVRSQVREIIGEGQSAPTGHIPFTPRAKKVLELSLREALQLGHNYIGTEHILLGVVREGEGVGAQVLQKLGADLNWVRQTVIHLLSGSAGEGEHGKQDRIEELATQEAQLLGHRHVGFAHRRLASIRWRLDHVRWQVELLEASLEQARREVAERWIDEPSEAEGSNEPPTDAGVDEPQP
jgi:ATP-dependent Clp protease ATP-binding subunit ClpC